MKININSPVILNNIISNLYNSLKESGYDLFNKSDSFYNDICSIFTTENGTDITLSDRRKLIYDINANTSICQNECQLDSYNSSNKKVKCKCSPQMNKTDDNLKINSILDNFDLKTITDSFISTIRFSNFLVLKCHKLAFNLKDILKNIGRILMTIIIFISFIFFIIFCIFDFNKVNEYIKEIYNLKLINGRYRRHNSVRTINKKKEILKRKNSKKSSKTLTNKSKGDSLDIQMNKNNNNIVNINQNNIVNTPPKRGIYIYKNKAPIILNNIESNLSYKKLLENESKRKIDMLNQRLSKKESNINYIQIENVNIGNSSLNRKIIKNKKCKTFKKKLSKKRLSVEYHISNQEKKKKKNENINNLNDEELNNLEYDKALIIDKRTYFQYYWSLLKKKHLLLFTFYPIKDYNLKTIKICLFLFSFSLYFTVNGFFFSDNTMHKIYMDNGKFNLIYLIPQIVYSSYLSCY